MNLPSLPGQDGLIVWARPRSTAFLSTRGPARCTRGRCRPALFRNDAIYLSRLAGVGSIATFSAVPAGPASACDRYTFAPAERCCLVSSGRRRLRPEPPGEAPRPSSPAGGLDRPSTMWTSMSDWTQTPSSAANRYLLFADISGYTAFMNGVEQAHGVDFSDAFRRVTLFLARFSTPYWKASSPGSKSPSWRGTPSLPSRRPIRSMGEALRCSPSYRRCIRRSWRDVLRPGRRTIICVRRARWLLAST